jgi:hypothetical protein
MLAFNRQQGQRAGNYHEGYYRRDTQAERPAIRDPTGQITQRAQLSQMQQMQPMHQLNQIGQMGQMSQMSQVSQQNKERRFMAQNIS